MKPVTTMPAAPKTNNDLQEKIRRRAHELYERRGYVDGFASDDWFRAEGEILKALKQTSAKAARASK